MGYIGNEPTTGHFPVDNLTSSGGSTYTLSKAPASAGAIEVSVQGILQPTTAYSVSGTTLTLAGVANNVNIFVRHLGETLSLPTPADGSVTTTKLAVDAVDSDHIVDGSVDNAHLAADAVDGTKLKDALIADFTEVTVATGDSILLGDATDSGNTKRDTVQGLLDLVHDATIGLQTIWIPAIAMVSPTTNGAEAAAVETTATRPEMKVLDFDSSTKEYAQFSVAMPKSWNLGTVTAKFYWTHATAVATDVIWGIQGVVVSDNDTIDIAYGTGVTVTDTFHNAAEDLAVTDSTVAITLDGTPAADDLAYFQVYRDAAAGGDTTNSTDARLLGVKILFTTDAENDN